MKDLDGATKKEKKNNKHCGCRQRQEGELVMYKNKRILVVVTDRGGSKGLPWKNILELNKKSLIALIIDCFFSIGQAWLRGGYGGKVS